MKLKEAREKKGFTQEKLAWKINITSRYYLEIEKGRSIPSVVLALEICSQLEVDPRAIEEWKR